ncbi:MAG: OmpA family protein, partial [Bryobacteraceae bacterium]
IVLSNSLLYSVREVFLIHRGTGVLLEQAAREAVTKDADMISSMFTAIQEFVRDSFIGTENTNLETIDAGSLKLWIQHGAHVMIAGALDGTPPLELKTVFRGALTEIQEMFSTELQTFEGDVTPFERTRPILERCLLGRSAAKRRKPLLLWALATVCIVLVAAGAYFTIIRRERWNGFLERLEKQPGIVVTRVEKHGAENVVFGLRDQLAVNPADLLRTTEIPPSTVKFQLEPYESLDAAFSLRRQFATDRQAIERSVIRFPQGDAQLSLTNLDEIETVAATISSFLQAAGALHSRVQIQITGHTDEVGSGESNFRLSAQRADGAKAALVADGIDESLLLARGVSTSEPVRKGTSDRHRSFNRSVTFRVIADR